MPTELWVFSALLPASRCPRQAFPQLPLAIPPGASLYLKFVLPPTPARPQSQKALRSPRTQLELQSGRQNGLGSQRCSSPHPFRLSSRNSKLSKARQRSNSKLPVGQEESGQPPGVSDVSRAPFPLAHEVRTLNDWKTRRASAPENAKLSSPAPPKVGLRRGPGPDPPPGVPSREMGPERGRSEAQRPPRAQPRRRKA